MGYRDSNVEITASHAINRVSPEARTHTLNALITRNIRPRFDKTVTKSDPVSIAALRDYRDASALNTR